MFTEWNKIGKAKAIFILFITLPNLILPMKAAATVRIFDIVVQFIFAVILIPLITKIVSKSNREISRPDWNDSPFNFKKPTSNFQFFAFFFLAIGLSILIGSGIKYYALNGFGLTTLSLSLGIFVGIRLTLNKKR